MKLTNEQLERYSRNIILFGGKGQKKLLAGKVLVIGAGGLGAPAALYLAAAGVGTIGIVDYDVVDLSNLQRQIIHSTASVGQRKVDSARHTLEGLNPDVHVVTYNEWVNSQTLPQIIDDQHYDFIIDATDNFPAKFLINDACVLGAVGGVIGCIQATEAIKYLLGQGELLTGALLTYDALTMRFRKIPIGHNPHCAICGDDPAIHELIDYEQPVCESKVGKGSL